MVTVGMHVIGSRGSVKEEAKASILIQTCRSILFPHRHILSPPIGTSEGSVAVGEPLPAPRQFQRTPGYYREPVE